MIDIKEKIAGLISGQVEDLTAEEIKDMIEVPQDKANGDYAFPCFRLARTASRLSVRLKLPARSSVRERQLDLWTNGWQKETSPLPKVA